VAGGLRGIEAAIHAVLDHAHYGDIMAALERKSGNNATYTATVYEGQAAWLATLDEPDGITHLGGGAVRFTSPAIAYMRSLPEHVGSTGCRVDNEDRLWIAGSSYRLTRER
jgi:hypothetical protein